MALDGLVKAADKIAADKLASLEVVFDLAKNLEDDLEKRLKEIETKISEALRRVVDTGNAYTTRSNEETDYYFRGQIIENAKNHLGYFADTSVYRSWVALLMWWSRRGQLVFTIHGIGKPFNGSLICSPFLEFKDTDEEGDSRIALVPVAEEGFIFFYNEQPNKLLLRFSHWRENVLKVALKELTQNL